ncbi:MAG: Gfo/Idh/MocA family oxidoreductase [Flavobacteriaceae bacterium]|nr:Gfo/Idh/MocA family oxidoreductase [Flavobacteriaceae bacterium]
MKKNKTRRSFIKNLTLGSSVMSSFPYLLSGAYNQKLTLDRSYSSETFLVNDRINLALIGCGIQGIYDTNAALKVAGVKLVAVCDLYTGRLDRAKELWGYDIFTSRDYRILLERMDIDAVIIATSDHWHKKITIEAMQLGKAVYCEKPMVQNFTEGHEIIKVYNKTGSICQIGSQGMSSLGNQKAKQLYEDGAIGEIIMLDMYNDRFSSEGAWQYAIPPDATPKTIDFDRFLGSAPKVPYDPKRFFRWRNYQDYGTGIAGDMFVHAFSSLNYILSSKGPKRALSTGGLRYWKDGRDVPDIALSFYDYPETKTHTAFNASLRVNFVAGSGAGGSFKIIGSEGAMEVNSNSCKLIRPIKGTIPGDYSMIAFTEETQKRIAENYNDKKIEKKVVSFNTGETLWEAPASYKGGHYDHFYNFFQAIRGKGKIIQDPTFGLRAAGAALLANESYYQAGSVNWNPETMMLL